MTRSIGSLFVASALLLLTACAQSFHQGERLGSVGGYYGSGYGWYGGGYGIGSQQSNAPAPRPAPPANAPPQFQKKY